MGPCAEYIHCCITANPELGPLLSDYTEEGQFYLRPVAWDTLSLLGLIKKNQELTLRGKKLLGNLYFQPLLYWLQKWNEEHSPTALITISKIVHGIHQSGSSIVALQRWANTRPNLGDTRVALLAGAPCILSFREAFFLERIQGLWA